MILESIEYRNFRPFKGTQKIDLRIDKNNPDANVIVLLGDNTFGKTTFVLSFIWCLYGESRFSKADSILNSKVEDSMMNGDTEIVSVKIEFEDGDKQYTMIRSQKFFKSNDRIVNGEMEVNFMYKTSDGEFKSVGNSKTAIQLAIESILPKDLSAFFFFEGEKNNVISRYDLKEAVETLIGLDALHEMKRHLYGETQNSPASDSVMGEYWSKVINGKNSSKDQKKEEEKKKEAEERLKNIEREIKEKKDSIDYYKREIDNINEKIKRAAPSEEIRKSLERNANGKARCLEDIDEDNRNLCKLFSEDSISLFLYPLLNKAGKVLHNMKIENKGIKGIDASGIKELLKRKECLCGTSLEKGSAAYKNVEQYLDYVPPRSVGISIKTMLDQIEEYQQKAKDFVDDFDNLYKRIISHKQEEIELDDERKVLLKTLKEVGSVNIDGCTKDLEDYTGKLSELNEQLEDKYGEKGACEYTIKTAWDNLQLHKTKNDESDRYNLYYDYARAIYEWANKDLLEKGNRIKKTLEENLQEIFDSIYRDHRDIAIDYKYNIELTYNGKHIDDTGGLRVIQYFSYVAAMVKLARSMMLERNNSIRLGEQYPLVLDAAFSHADEQHTKNIAKVLADTVPQLVFAVMNKDWNLAKDGLIGKIAKTYELKKKDETEIQIIEVK